ncbi:hypothetical protein [Methylocystis echinoides]|jgi:hypothetical protein|uniref:hypothetical protein n=1 Tax=Methylocystis echinoides TaxID=29468 RepID=UPI00343C89E2
MQDEARATLATMQQLGASMRLSLEAVTYESLPDEIGLLLLRLALAELLKRAAEEEAREGNPQSGPEEWIGLERWAWANATIAWSGRMTGR